MLLWQAGGKTVQIIDIAQKTSQQVAFPQPVSQIHNITSSAYFVVAGTSAGGSTDQDSHMYYLSTQESGPSAYSVKGRADLLASHSETSSRISQGRLPWTYVSSLRPDKANVARDTVGRVLEGDASSWAYVSIGVPADMLLDSSEGPSLHAIPRLPLPNHKSEKSVALAPSSAFGYFQESNTLVTVRGSDLNNERISQTLEVIDFNTGTIRFLDTSQGIHKPRYVLVRKYCEKYSCFRYQWLGTQFVHAT